MVLTWLSLRCHFAGRFWDILRDLSEVGSFPESHGSPSGSSNKRVYISDEQTDPPPPDSASEASPNRRGPIVGSKQPPLSLGSAARGSTSVTSNKDAPPPTSTTNPTPQDTREHLSIFPAAGSVSTPERAGGSETGISPSTIFGSSAIPITTNDLGRLPLHYGVRFPMDFDFPAIANGWNASGSSRTPTGLGGANPNYGLGHADGVNSRGTQSRGIYGLYPPQEQQPEDLFPWISYTTTIGAGGTTADSVPTFATAEATTRPNATSTYVPTYPSHTKPTADQLDSTILSLFGEVPPTPSTALGLPAGSLPGPALNTTENHTDPFNVLFPPSPSGDTYIPPIVGGTEQPRDGGEEREYGSLPVGAQAYLRGWSNAPQAFGQVALSLLRHFY